MDIRKHFEYNPVLDLTAANIGVNKWDWVSINKEDEKRAKRIMKSKRFDILPIVGEDGQVKKFFSTRIWNKYDSLNCTSINDTNTIYYRTNFNDLISKFREEQSHFYFLANHKEILGLVSYANLNCQAVYNYLYQLLADIERSITLVLENYLDPSVVKDHFQKSDDKHLNALFETFETASDSGVEVTIFELFYLQTVGITMNEFCKVLPVHLKKLNKYHSKFAGNGVYGQLRNKIMHPVRPILSDQVTISQMDELLTDYAAIKEILSKRSK